jgi:hypothetical protein
LGWWEVLDAGKQRAIASFQGAETNEENEANAILFSIAHGMARALESIAQTLEAHMLYMGKGLSVEDLEIEGGDAATVTWLAYEARKALNRAGQNENERQRA